MPAIEKASIVLGILADSREPLTFGQIAARVSMAPSSLHDVCSKLTATGLAERGADGRYSVGLRVVELARRRLSSMEIVSTFQAVCRSLAPPEETIVLSVLNGSDVIYVSFIDGGRPLAVRYELGMRLPAAFTASGKAMLATLEPEEVERRIGPVVQNPNAWGQRKDIAALLAELEATRHRGYSIDDEETARGMTCIGVPVFSGSQQRAIGAIAISLVKSTANWFDTRTSDLIRGIAAAISEQLGSAVTWSRAQSVGE